MNRALKINYNRFKREPNFRFSSYLILIVLIISTALLSINVIGTTYDYKIGDISREDIRTSREIQYVIETETEMKRKRTMENVPLVFDKDQSILIERLRRVEKLFKYVTKILIENPPIGS